MKKKYYFVDESFAEFDDDNCYSKDVIIDAMKEQGINELKVFTAKKQDIPDYFYCLAVQDISEKGECGKQCCDYRPRNGKSGICKYYGFFHEPDKELTFKI
jgi:hypothetical protein